MLEDNKRDEPSEISKSGEPQTVHIFVGGLRRPTTKQNTDPVALAEKPLEQGKGLDTPPPNVSNKF